MIRTPVCPRRRSRRLAEVPRAATSKAPLRLREVVHVSPSESVSPCLVSPLHHTTQWSPGCVGAKPAPRPCTCPASPRISGPDAPTLVVSHASTPIPCGRNLDSRSPNHPLHASTASRTKSAPPLPGRSAPRRAAAPSPSPPPAAAPNSALRPRRYPRNYGPERDSLLLDSVAHTANSYPTALHSTPCSNSADSFALAFLPTTCPQKIKSHATSRSPIRKLVPRSNGYVSHQFPSAACEPGAAAACGSRGL